MDSVSSSPLQFLVRLFTLNSSTPFCISDHLHIWFTLFCSYRGITPNHCVWCSYYIWRSIKKHKKNREEILRCMFGSQSKYFTTQYFTLHITNICILQVWIHYLIMSN